MGEEWGLREMWAQAALNLEWRWGDRRSLHVLFVDDDVGSFSRLSIDAVVLSCLMCSLGMVPDGWGLLRWPMATRGLMSSQEEPTAYFTPVQDDVVDRRLPSDVLPSADDIVTQRPAS